jgi:SAM-dependent methyltransferase
MDQLSTGEHNRSQFERLIADKAKVIVELGCGPNKTSPDTIGIDLLAMPGVDIVHNAEEGLHFIPDNSVDEISSSHFLEHIVNFEMLMREIHRILKPGGLHKVMVPHFSNPHYYSDFTHKRFFGLYTFDYFSKAKDQSLKRKVPDFYVDFHFIVIRRDLLFIRYFSMRNFFTYFFARPVFNSSDGMKELYENKFCYTFPCKEIYFEMKAVK